MFRILSHLRMDQNDNIKRRKSFAVLIEEQVRLIEMIMTFVAGKQARGFASLVI